MTSLGIDMEGGVLEKKIASGWLVARLKACDLTLYHCFRPCLTRFSLQTVSPDKTKNSIGGFTFLVKKMLLSHSCFMR